jgi:hypothetical protein
MAKMIILFIYDFCLEVKFAYHYNVKTERIENMIKAIRGSTI